MGDTCYFSQSLEPELTGITNPVPSWNNPAALLSDSQWEDKVGRSYWNATYYRQNQSSAMASNHYCEATVGQEVGMISDWNSVPGGFNSSYWGAGGRGYATYKYNDIRMGLFDAMIPTSTTLRTVADRISGTLFRSVTDRFSLSFGPCFTPLQLLLELSLHRLWNSR